MELTEKEANLICDNFMKFHGWNLVDFVNKSKNARSFLIENEEHSLFLFDSYVSMAKYIQSFIIDDLDNNDEKWSFSFYLTLEQMDILDLSSYVSIDPDYEKVLDDLKLFTQEKDSEQ